VQNNSIFPLQLDGPRISTFLLLLKSAGCTMLLPTKGQNATAARKQPKKSDLQVGMTYLWLDMADHILNFLARVLY
jgi:hypothetical protein